MLGYPIGMSRTKTFGKAPFCVVLDREWPGCPTIWVGTSRNSGFSLGFYETKLWVDFSFPIDRGSLPGVGGMRTTTIGTLSLIARG